MGKLSGHCSRAPGNEQCGIIFYIAFLLFPVYNDDNLRRFPLPTNQKYTVPVSLNTSPFGEPYLRQKEAGSRKAGYFYEL